MGAADVISTVGERKRLLELRQHLIERAYMDPAEVAAIRGVSESTVRRYPPEVLPCEDATPTSSTTLRRYHPDDVRALSAVLRAWKRAIRAGREEAWLSERREMLEARDAALLAP